MSNGCLPPCAFCGKERYTLKINGTPVPQCDCQAEATPRAMGMVFSMDVDDAEVILSDYMGDDLSVVNAARVSFGKRETSLDAKGMKLIKYLAEHRHMSPFRHVVLQLTLQGVSEVVMRQLYRHQIGCAYTSGEFREVATVWNEISGRYVELQPEFHMPTAFRKQHQSNKQASLEHEIVENNQEAIHVYKEALEDAYHAYQRLLELGVCREQARMVMPICFKNSVVWTASLEAIAHFVKLRDHEGAQLEIRNLARAVHKLALRVAPYSTTALLGEM